MGSAFVATVHVVRSWDGWYMIEFLLLRSSICCLRGARSTLDHPAGPVQYPIEIRINVAGRLLSTCVTINFLFCVLTSLYIVLLALFMLCYMKYYFVSLYYYYVIL